MITFKHHPVPTPVGHSYWEARSEAGLLLGWLCLRIEGYVFLPHSPSELSAGNLVDIGSFMKDKTDEYFASQGQGLLS